MKIIGICAVYNEADIINLSVRHHLCLGFDAVLVSDGGSADGTRSILAALSRHGPVTWHDQRPGEFVEDLRTRMARAAHAMGADWVVPFDADEFWHVPRSTLREVLAGAPAGVLCVEVRNFIQNRRQRQATPECLLEMTRRPAQLAGQEPIEQERSAYVELDYPRHVAFRPTPDIQVLPGFHGVVGTSGQPCDTDALVVLHAPLRAFDVLECKAGHGLRWRDRLVGNMGWHWKRFARLLEENHLEEEWRANSHEGGWLHCFGIPHPTVHDDTLRAVVSPLLERN
jgi:glycosyltransferase involved in cell wall biosynthesis